MTPEEWARIAVPCFGPPHCTGNDHDYECDRHDPERFNRAVEQISAALRERDAAHEIALKKARADALGAAARQADAAAENWLGSMGRANKEHDHTAEKLSWASMDACRYVAQRIRALLEEAGK